MSQYGPLQQTSASISILTNITGSTVVLSSVATSSTWVSPSSTTEESITGGKASPQFSSLLTTTATKSNGGAAVITWVSPSLASPSSSESSTAGTTSTWVPPPSSLIISPNSSQETSAEAAVSTPVLACLSANTPQSAETGGQVTNTSDYNSPNQSNMSPSTTTTTWPIIATQPPTTQELSVLPTGTAVPFMSLPYMNYEAAPPSPGYGGWQNTGFSRRRL